MDNILTAKIEKFLNIKSPTDEQIREAATLLLQCNPARERAIYNTAMISPKSTLPWIRTDLKKYLGIRKRGLELPQVKEYNEQVLEKVKKTLTAGIRGKREDHDSLPPEIQTLWEKNAETWKKISQLHAQLAQMIAKPDYQPCDGNELCHVMGEANAELHKNYAKYDGYSTEGEDSRKKVDDETGDVQVISSARTTISRGLNRRTQTDESLQKIREAVAVIVSKGQKLKPKTVERLNAIGISVPDNA